MAENMETLSGKKVILGVTGGIAAYKSLELIRRLRERSAWVTPVLTRAAEEFVTPLSVSSLAGEKVYRDLFDLTDEAEMGHIQLSRSADLIVVAPGTADLMAKMANGMANDMASTLLLATDTPVLVAPAMNVRMWDHPATQRNLAQCLHQPGQVHPLRATCDTGQAGGANPDSVVLQHFFHPQLRHADDLAGQEIHRRHDWTTSATPAALITVQQLLTTDLFHLAHKRAAHFVNRDLNSHTASRLKSVEKETGTSRQVPNRLVYLSVSLSTCILR